MEGEDEESLARLDWKQIADYMEGARKGGS
jgi:hypothetical protein